ncbi:MAG: aldehyde dehydrogenase family protein [Saprospiraceae bacterium]
MELGGSDAFVVLKDADLEKAAEVAVKSRMNNSGANLYCCQKIYSRRSGCRRIYYRLEK